MWPCKNSRMNASATCALGLAVLMAILPSASLAGEIVVPEGTRVALQLNDHLSTKENHEGDAFTAVVMAPVYQGDRVVIPKGSSVMGSISRISRPGRFKGKPVMNLLFQYISIPGHGQLPIVAVLEGLNSEGNPGVRPEGTVEGEGSVGRDIGKVLTPGLVGAGVGGLARGGRGAGIGAGVGVAVGLATVFATRGKDLELQRGSTLNISLERPLSIPSENEAARNR
jgi:hypothetical protein